MRAHGAVRLVSTTLRKTIRTPLTDWSGPDAVVKLIISMIGQKDREHLVVVHCSTQHHPTAIEVAAIGDLSSAVVHPREVFKAAILANAAAIVVGHNHPSGDVSPSDNDRATARNLRLAGIILGLPVIDFLIVSGNRWHSVETDS
jgi:DNA repair protein RadC